MASMSENQAMADGQIEHQLLDAEPAANTMDETTTSDNQRQLAELALRLSGGGTDESAMQVGQPEVPLPANGDANGSILQISDHNDDGTTNTEVNVDMPLAATELVEPEQQNQEEHPSLEQNTTETIQKAHKVMILTLPSPPLTAPQAGENVTHRPELRWETRDGAPFYREPGNATSNNGIGNEVEGWMDVFWKPSGYFSWFVPTEQEKEVEEQMSKAMLLGDLALYSSPALDYNPMYHDLVTDQRYYFHKRQPVCDPAKAAASAVRETYLQMVSELGNKRLPEPLEEAPTLSLPSTAAAPIPGTSFVWPPTNISGSSPDSRLYPEAPINPLDNEILTPQQDPAVKDVDEAAVYGIKRPGPVTPESAQKRAKTTPSSPTTPEVNVEPPPTLMFPVAPRTPNGNPKDVTAQQWAYMLDLHQIRQEPLIRDERPEIVWKVLFDKTEAKWKPKSKTQASPTIAVAKVTTSGRTRPVVAALSSAGGSQENPISLDTPEGKVYTPRVGTAGNPITVELGIAEEDVSVISPVSFWTSPASSSTPGSELSWPKTPVRASAPSQDPFAARVTRSADKKTATSLRRDGFEFYQTNDGELLRYQNMIEDQGVVPGTLLPDGRQPDRLLIDNFRKDSKKLKETTSNFSPRKYTVHPKNTPLNSKEYWENWLQHKNQATPTTADSHTAAARQRWIDDAPRSSSQPALLRGFPMVEMVMFVRANNRQDEGNCYWNALSLHMYGRPDFGERVKLEHLRHVEAVLNTPQHPRHEAYTNVNARFFQTNAEGLSGGPFVANMWQILHLPGSWTPSWMTQITADVYGVFVVLYTLKCEKRLLVTETTTRGAYNSRHIFLLFVDGNHYQPMIPNEFDPSEFRCPRPSKELTKAYVFGDSKRWGEGVTHGWRNDVSFGNRVPMSLPVDHNMGATYTDTERLLKAVVEGGTGSWKSEL
ncbi:uncharacterized protein PgNI_03658 [Pyricularia grisea]|uniref:OTU domain-containing protein n=1 Tax=Pyricularia grisea TaxID=148305 RepID=A0A6P8BC83_PYRGI|nr:uncharacterized protein PgNI_03658 [Pyricularia grisea]TLD13408.1 hypothetical protein PgNI_03658 [Pyricularia grisea]